MIIMKFVFHVILMQDFTAKQSIWDSQGEVSATNVYYKFIQLKWRNRADCSCLLIKQYVAHNWLIAELGWPALASY